MYLQINALEANQVLGVLRDNADRAREGVDVEKSYGKINEFQLRESLERLKHSMHLIEAFQDALTLSQVDDMFEARKAI